ncbi:MAG: hypothetical protein ACPGSM_12960 [Thiolinea sp.]
MAIDDRIKKWVGENIRLFPGDVPESIDLWEEAVCELIRLAMPENVAFFLGVEVQAIREGAEPDTALIKIKHAEGVFYFCFSITDFRGQALLTPVSRVAHES